MSDPTKPAAKIPTKNTFASDKRKPGTYLARIEVSGDEPWPDFGSVVTLTRLDGSEARVRLGDKCVWSGPDSKKAGVDVALFTIAESLDKQSRRAPPKKASPESPAQAKK